MWRGHQQSLDYRGIQESSQFVKILACKQAHL